MRWVAAFVALWLMLPAFAYAQCSSRNPTACGGTVLDHIQLGTKLNLTPLGSAPTGPQNGDIWSTASGFFGQINGATVGPFGTGNISGPGPTTSGYLPAWNGTTGTALTTGVPFGTTGANTILQTTSGGTIAPTVIPAPGTATFGGILGLTAATSGQFVSYIDTSGVQHLATPATAAGTDGQVQVNVTGALGGVTLGGDATLNPTTGALTVVSAGGVGFGSAAFMASSAFLAPTGSGAALTGLTLGQIGGAGSLAALSAAPAGTLTGSALANGVTSAPGLASAAGGNFGTAAYVATGTSGGTVPLLNQPAAWSQPQTFSATGTALTVNNNAAVQGTLTNGTGSGAARFTQGSTGNWIFQTATGGTGGIYSGNTGTPALLTWSSSTNSITSTNLFVLGTQNTGTPNWTGGTISAMTPFYSNLTWGGTSTVSGQPTPLAEFIQATDNVAAPNGTALMYLAMNPGALHQGDAHLLQLSMLPLAKTASTSSSTFDLLNLTVIDNFNQGGTGLSTSSAAWGAAQSYNAVASLGPHATFLNNLSNSEDDISAAGEVVTAAITGTSMAVSAGCSATITANDSVQSYAAWTLSSNIVNVNTQIVSGSCTGSTGTFVITPSQTVTSEQMVVGSSVYTKDSHLLELLGPDEVAGTALNAGLVFGATNSPTTSQGLTYLLQVGAVITNNPIPNGWVLGYAATTPFGSGITTAGVFDFSNLTVTTAYMRSDATNSKFVLDLSGNWTAEKMTSLANIFAVSSLTTWTDTQTCAAGQMTWDANYVYVCTSANIVKRAALSTF